MAVMYPARPPAKITQDPLRAFEVLVFNALKDQLSDDYQVVYSAKWAEETHSEVHEADFIIINHERGYLVVEAKGGNIRYNRDEELWEQDGKPLKQSPWDQASDNEWFLRQALESIPLFDYELPHDNLVVLQGTLGNTAIFPAGHQSRTVAGQNHILGKRVVELMSRMRSWADIDSSRSSRDVIIQHLLRILDGTQIETQQDWRSESSELTAQFDEKETWLINQDVRKIMFNNRTDIVGGAGTGKTVLAQEIAVRLSKNNFRVLWICFNSLLRDFVSAKLHRYNESIDVVNYDLLRRRLIETHGGDVGNLFYGQWDEDEIQLNFDIAIDDVQVDEKYDALIIDEAQDIRPAWFNSLRNLLTEPEHSNIYIFRDDNQLIYGTGENLYLQGFSRYPLFENMRNTSQIHSHAKALYTGHEYLSSKIQGLRVEFVPKPSMNEVEQSVKSLAENFEQKGYLNDDIVVLTGENRASRRKLVDDHPLIDYYENNSKGVVQVETLRRFKGLEADILILIGLNGILRDQEKRRELLYVAMTRAKKLLFVIGNEEELKIVRSMTRK